MRKLLITILFFICSIYAFAQTFPLMQGIGNKTTNVHTTGTFSTTTGFTFSNSFSDTSEANVPSYIRFTPGIEILVAGSQLWIRNQAATAWVQVSGAGGGITNLATGFGLKGGPITTTGTIFADSTILPTRWSVAQYDSLVWNPITTIETDGDSYTGGFASENINKIYPAQLRDSLVRNLSNRGTNSAGWYTVVRAVLQSNYLSSSRVTLNTVLVGLLDYFSNGYTDRNKTKIQGLVRTYLSNLFTKTAVSFHNSSVTRSGFSTTTAVTCQTRSQALSDTAVVSTAAGSTLSFSFTGDNLVIGTFASIPGATIGAFNVVIDGVNGFGSTYWRQYNGSETFVGQTNYSLANESSTTMYPDVIVIRGLTSGAHTCVITTTSTTSTYLDYYLVMDQPANVLPVVIGFIPHQDENVFQNYFTPYNKNINWDLDKLNSTIREAALDFTDYPLSMVDVNKFYSPYTMVQRPDNLHPKTIGQNALYAAFRYALRFRTFDRPISAPPDKFVDTIYRTPGKDSILWIKNGYTYSILDSLGSSVNIYNSDGSLTGNRTVTLGANQLYIRSGLTNDAFLKLSPAASTSLMQVQDGTASTSFELYGVTGDDAHFYLTSNDGASSASIYGDGQTGVITATGYFISDGGFTASYPDNASSSKSYLEVSSESTNRYSLMYATNGGSNISSVKSYSDSLLFKSTTGYFRFFDLLSTIDTTTYKPAVFDVNGKMRRGNSWAQFSASSGTVTSVSFTGGLISVGTPTTTPAFTVAGTSGGIPYFSSTSTWASSALLAANALMIGGGAGTAPSTTTTGSGVLTFLGTPSWTNFNSMITGTAPFWSLATGGTLTGTNTITAGTNPLIFSTGVTTGTGATAGFQITANSLTTGNGFDISSSSLQSGAIVKIASTSTALAAGNAASSIAVSGANGTNAITATGEKISVTNTNATSGTNIGLDVTASGATTANIAINATGDIRGSTLVRTPILVGSGSANGTVTIEGNNAGSGNTSTSANILFKSGDTPTQAMDILNNGMVRIGASPNTTSGFGLTVDQPNDGASDIAIKLFANNHTASMTLGYQKISTSGAMIINSASTGIEVTGPSGTTMSVAAAATAPTSTLSVFGSFGVQYVAKTGTYTATAADQTIEATSGTFTITLPTAVGITGRLYVVTNSGSGTVTVGTTSSQTFVNVTATPTTLTLAQFSTVILESNGANWLRLTSL